MIRRPPRSTRTDTSFPYTTRFRALQEAIAAGEIDLADDRFQVPRLKAVPKDPAVDETRRCLFREIGSAQLPDVIVETDARTGFSTTLLNRKSTRLNSSH